MNSAAKNPKTSDLSFMRIALGLARRGLGQTWPNPTVGALIVKDNCIIAQGTTAKGGRPHAETIALEAAGEHARGATLYVTLEPCSHHGQTPPCMDAIIKAGIARCVIACRDTNPKVSSVDALQQAGIEVIEGICEEQARAINAGFFSVIEKKRPYVAVKIATSADGKISFPNSSPMRGEGNVRWITSEPARAYTHLLRSQYDAIATGIGTVLADDPRLTCRLPGLGDRSPVRVVFDRQGRLPKDCQLAKTADQLPVWVFSCHPERGKTESKDLIPNVEILRYAQNDSLQNALTQLAERGITRLFVEGGAALTTAFMESGHVDRLYWFKAPLAIGEGGLSVEKALSGLAHWRHIDHIPLPPDQLDIFDV